MIRLLVAIRLMQKRGSLDVSLDVSIPITTPSVSAMASVWSWCSNGNLLNATQVGNARLLELSGLNPGTQLCIMHVPHLNLKGDSIKALCSASEFSPLRKKNPLPTLLQNDTELPLSSWLRACSHLFMSWRAG